MTFYYIIFIQISFGLIWFYLADLVWFSRIRLHIKAPSKWGINCIKMSYCKICIENDKKKKRLFDLFTDKFKCEDEGRFLYRCKDCWQYSLALYSYVYINKEKCDNFSYKKWCLKGLRRQFCTKTFVSVQKSILIWLLALVD